MILILMGKSAVGKDSVVDTLVDVFDFARIISYTTRPMRDGEVSGRTYHFISPDEFEEMRADMIDARSYYTKGDGFIDIWQYGTKKVKNYNPAKHYICILDPNGVRNYIKAYGRDQIYIVELKCDEKLRRERAVRRGSFDEVEWARREESDTITFRGSLYGFTPDATIFNDKDYFYDTVDEILTKYLRYYFEQEILKARQVLVNATCMHMAMKYIDIDEKVVDYDPDAEKFMIKEKEESNDGQAEITIDELHDSE